MQTKHDVEGLCKQILEACGDKEVLHTNLTVDDLDKDQRSNLIVSLAEHLESAAPLYSVQVVRGGPGQINISLRKA